MRCADDLMRPLATCAPCLAATIGLVFVAVGGLPGEAAAQQRPESFTLPEPGPTPAPAPQGPVDVREGVVIGPRVIEEPAPPERSDPAPARTPAADLPRLEPMASPAPSPFPNSPVGPPVPLASGAQATTSGEAPPPTDGTTARERATPDAAASPSLGNAASLPAPSTPAATPAATSDVGANLELRVHRPGLLDLLRAYEGWILSGLALLVALLLQFWIAERRRRAALLRLSPPTPRSEEGAGRAAHPRPAAAPDPSPPAGIAQQPQRIDLRLDVVSATRSVMTLTLDLRLTIANRSDRAVRGLLVAAQLDCARPGKDAAGAIGAGEPFGEIARIGAQQGATLAGQLRLPVADLHLIRHGSARVYIPLLHVTFEGEGVPATLRTFVIGTPSAGGAGRLHPLPVGTQVGSIPGLAAQSVRIPQAPAAPAGSLRTAPEPA